MACKISLFITCSADLLYPNVPIAAVRVLEALGVEIDFRKEQTCCGQPFLNTGDLTGARRQALHFAETFADAQTVVAVSASCVDTIRNRYPALFPEGGREREAVLSASGKILEFTEFISTLLPPEKTPQLTDGIRTTYHSSCRTLRGLGLRGTVERYLTAMLGENFLPLPDAETCCGFGGTFSVKLPEVSEKMMADKLAAIESTRAGRVVSLDLGCVTHLSTGAGKNGPAGLNFVHLAELLAEALRADANHGR